MSTEGFTPSAQAGAERARTIQARIAFPSDADFEAMVRTNAINTLPIPASDVLSARRIYGPDVPSIRG